MTFLRFEQLPDGVTPLRDYASLGCSLVECHHAIEHRIWIKGWHIAVGGFGTPDDRPFCRLCRTVNPGRPVKMLAILPKPQAALF